MSNGLAEDDRSGTMRLLASRQFVDAARVPNDQVSEDVHDALEVELDVEDLVEEQDPAAAKRKARKSSKPELARGRNGWEKILANYESLSAGFYFSFASR